jgi:hypothetical protein
MEQYVGWWVDLACQQANGVEMAQAFCAAACGSGVTSIVRETTDAGNGWREIARVAYGAGNQSARVLARVLAVGDNAACLIYTPTFAGGAVIRCSYNGARSFQRTMVPAVRHSSQSKGEDVFTQGVSFPDRSHGWLLIADGALGTARAPSQQTVLWSTKNGGRSWQAIYLGPARPILLSGSQTPPNSTPAALGMSAADVRVCARDQVSLKGGETVVGMTVTRQYILTNTSNTACTLYGTPRLAFLRADGRPVAGLTAQAAPSGARPTRVSVQPGGHASFEITTGSCAYDPHINPNMPTTTVITIPGERKPFTYLSRFSPQCSEQRSFVSSIVPGVRPIPNVVVIQPKRDRGLAPNGPVGSLICRTSHLMITMGDSFAGLGTAGANVRFINDSGATCKLHGWPTLIAETAPPGSAHADAEDWSGTDFPDVSQVGVPMVILKPHQRADAIVEAADGSPSSAPCGPAYLTLRVKPPGNTSSVTISAWIPYLDQFLPSCSQIRLSPVLASTAVYKG